MANYRRARVPGGTYFFTVNLLDRRRGLLVERVDALRTAFLRTRTVRPFTVIAAVVLPDHLHCIWRLPEGAEDNAIRWRQIKGLFSLSQPRDEVVTARRVARRERGIWQPRFWERQLVDDRDLIQHIDYVHRNPVKHGLVQRTVDWPFSSFHRYVSRGLLPPDWGDA